MRDYTGITRGAILKISPSNEPTELTKALDRFIRNGSLLAVVGAKLLAFGVGTI